MSVIVLSCSIILLIIVLYNYSKHKDTFNAHRVFIDCVVARYNESVSWLKMKQFQTVSRFLIYNKGKPLLEEIPNNAIEIMVPNVGKCDHTYLYHIINNYDNLADVTLFVSGRADDKRKGPKIIKTMRLINRKGNSVFCGHKVNIPNDLYYFQIDNWLSQSPENQVGDGSITKLAPANIRPFGNWFNHHWPGKSIDLLVYQSIFGVHKDHITQHPIEYYKKFHDELNYDVNPEAGHYIERAWVMIFSPLPRNCLYFQLF